jgi:hypothetical protein
MAAARKCANDAQAKAQAEQFMTAEDLVGLIEEMMDLKIQSYAQSHLKLTPELTRMLYEKRETDRRRLERIRVELVQFLNS